MDMIKKIAFTASTMLFVLAQIFSFYVIYINQKEKIDLLKEKEGKAFLRNIAEFSVDLQNINYNTFMEEYIVTYYFRENMSENSALYKEEREIFNSTSYAFDVKKVDFGEREYPCYYKTEKIDNKYLLIFYDYYEKNLLLNKDNKYYFFYVVDITYIYKKSWSLVIREILISTFFAFLMDLLLLFLIKKITRPLQAINEAQRQLIGSMSHELKTPLTAIKGYSETLLSVKLSKEQEEKALNYINQESGRLSRLSEKMMELTRLYEPECKITMQTISIEALFENVENSVKQRLEEKGLLLVREGNYLGKKLNADSDLMTSFLLNLINNSIMASESGSHIYLGADDTSIWVRDEGSGVPKEELEKVRKAFYRVDKSRSRKSGNMGLGLALCDQIAMVHHGRMKIESEVGKGTKIIYQSFTNE